MSQGELDDDPWSQAGTGGQDLHPDFMAAPAAADEDFATDVNVVDAAATEVPPRKGGLGVKLAFAGVLLVVLGVAGGGVYNLYRKIVPAPEVAASPERNEVAVDSERPAAASSGMMAPGIPADAGGGKTIGIDSPPANGVISTVPMTPAPAPIASAALDLPAAPPTVVNAPPPPAAVTALPLAPPPSAVVTAPPLAPPIAPPAAAVPAAVTAAPVTAPVAAAAPVVPVAPPPPLAAPTPSPKQAAKNVDDQASSHAPAPATRPAVAAATKGTKDHQQPDTTASKPEARVRKVKRAAETKERREARVRRQQTTSPAVAVESASPARPQVVARSKPAPAAGPKAPQTAASEPVTESATTATLTSYRIESIEPKFGEHQVAWVRHKDGRLHVVTAGDSLDGGRVVKIDGASYTVKTTQGDIR